MNTPETPKSAQPRWVFVFQMIPSILLLMCTLFGIFIGMRFLTFLEQEETHRISISNKWTETGFEQLQQMNATIKQELDLITEQRHENQVLQYQIQELNATLARNNAQQSIAPTSEAIGLKQ